PSAAVEGNGGAATKRNCGSTRDRNTAAETNRSTHCDCAEGERASRPQQNCTTVSRQPLKSPSPTESETCDESELVSYCWLPLVRSTCQLSSVQCDRASARSLEATLGRCLSR